MSIDKTDLSKKVLLVATTLGVTISAPYIAPFVIPFISPLVIEWLKAGLGPVLPNITANALWEMKDSFHPASENHDLSRLLANAYSQAIKQLLQEVEVNDKYKNFREMTKLALPSIKERIDRALKINSADELIKIFPSKEYLEKQQISAQEPEKVSFFLRVFGYQKTPKAPINRELANQSSTEDFILSIAEDAATAKQIITNEIEISVRRWFKEENPTSEKFPVSLTPFVFEKLAEIIPIEISELVKTPEHERSWVAFQRSYLQALFKEAKNNKRLSEQTIELLLPLAEKLDRLSRLEGVPEKLAELSQIYLSSFDKLETVIEANQAELLDAINEGERHLLQEIEELNKQLEGLQENLNRGNLSLEEIQLRLENQTRFLEILSGRFGDAEVFKPLADEIKLLSEKISSYGNPLSKDRLKLLLKDITPAHSKGIQRFSYYNIQDTFIGRDEVVNHLLDEFLSAPNLQSPKFQHRYLEGEAGVGKSRLALELVRQVKQEWPLSGVVRHDNREEVIECLCSKDWTPPEPTFIVIDYAVEALTDIRRMLITLASRREGFQHPLRILLLARSSDHDMIKKLIPKDSEGGPVAECALKEIELKGLNPASCLEIMRGRIKSEGGNEKNFSDEELDDILVSIDENRLPLWAAIAGELVGLNASFLSAHTKREGNEIARRKSIREILGREFEIWEKREFLFAGQSQKMLRQKHERLLALVTMTRGLSLRRVWSLAGDTDPDLLPRRAEFDSNFYSIISDHNIEFREGEHWLSPLEPDVFGEGFVEMFFSKDRENQSLFEEDLKELAWRLKPSGIAEFAVLFEFDFGSVQGNPLRFLPTVPPREGLERIAVSQALVGVSYTRIIRLFESEKWSDPAPKPGRLAEHAKGVMREGFRSLQSIFETESGRPLLEE